MKINAEEVHCGQITKAVEERLQAKKTDYFVKRELEVWCKEMSSSMLSFIILDAE